MKWTFRSILLLIVGALVWTGIYAYETGFSSSWRNALAKEFRRHGLEITVHRVTLDPFRGLVAKDVRIYDGGPDGDILAEISEIGLDVNVQNVIYKENFLNSVDLTDATLSLPLDRSRRDGPKLNITGLKAKAFFPPGQIQLNFLEFDFHTIRFAAKGMMLVPSDYQPGIGGGESDVDWSGWLQELVSRLDALEFPDGPASVSVEFTGDISSMEEIAVTRFLVESGRIVHEKFQLASVFVEASLDDSLIQLRRMQIKDDADGELYAAGFFDLVKAAGRFQLRSELNLPGLFGQLADQRLPDLELEFLEPPRLETQGEISYNEGLSFQLTGALALGAFSIRGVEFDSLRSYFAWDGDQALLREFSLAHSTGLLTAQLHTGAEGVRAEFSSGIDPSIAEPFLDEHAAKFLSEWKFVVPPKIHLEISGPSFSLDTLRASGRMEVESASYRGTSIDSGSAEITLADKAATYSNAILIRPEGQATGTFVYDFGKGEARLEGVRMNLNPMEAARWVGENLVRDITPYRFSTPPFLELNGTVNMRNALGTRLNIQLNSPNGLRYTFLGKELPISRARASLDFVDRVLFLRDIDADLFGGAVTGGARISLDRSNPGYEAGVEVRELDFESVTQLYFGYRESDGKLSGNAGFSGRGGDPMFLKGKGTAAVEDGDVFAIPVFGPLSQVLEKMLPGAGYSKARRAEAGFTINEGVIETSDFEVIGNGFSMIGGGKLFFIKDRMDFDIRINAQGLPGVLLFPVSKIFEYTSQETMKNPVWKPKILSQ